MEQVTATIDGTRITHVKAQGNGYRVNHTMFCPIGSRFEPNIQQWIAEGGVVEPEETASEKQARLLAYAEQKWQKVEQGGFTHGTTKFRSLPDSVSRISTAVQKAMRSKRDAQLFSTNWPDINGNPVALDATGIEALQDALYNHGQKAHQTYIDVVTKIKGGTITSESEIDAASWPS